MKIHFKKSKTKRSLKKKKQSEVACLADSVLLWHEPFGRGCGAAWGSGFQCADLPATGWGARLCFTLPVGFLSDMQSCMLDLQWHFLFRSFFLQIYLLVAPQTITAALSRGSMRA